MGGGAKKTILVLQLKNSNARARSACVCVCEKENVVQSSYWEHSSSITKPVRNPGEITFLCMPHREIIVQLSYNSGHSANPFSPLLSPSHGIPCALSSDVAKN